MTVLSTAPAPWQSAEAAERVDSAAALRLRDVRLSWPDGQDDDGRPVRSADPDLTLPHPRAHERAFVLVPWLEVDADAELPGHGRVRDLVAALDPAEIGPEEFDGLLAAAGLLPADPGGDGALALPSRMAAVNALLDRGTAPALALSGTLGALALLALLVLRSRVPT